MYIDVLSGSAKAAVERFRCQIISLARWRTCASASSQLHPIQVKYSALFNFLHSSSRRYVAASRICVACCFGYVLMYRVIAVSRGKRVSANAAYNMYHLIT